MAQAIQLFLIVLLNGARGRLQTINENNDLGCMISGNTNENTNKTIRCKITTILLSRCFVCYHTPIPGGVQNDRSNTH